MAGRGRGRGRGISFNVESLGFGRGEALPTPILQPPPVYAIAQFKPVPVEPSEDLEYLLALKQELRTAMKDSVYVIKPTEKKQEIERYSDKYQHSQAQEQAWTPDWKRLPAELQPRKKRTVRGAGGPSLAVKRKKAMELDLLNKQLDLLTDREEQQGEAGREQDGEEAGEEEEAKKADGEDQDDEEELEVFDEDDLEEETDYNMTYFDNGENFGGDEDDDLDEGPTY